MLHHHARVSPLSGPFRLGAADGEKLDNHRLPTGRVPTQWTTGGSGPLISQLFTSASRLEFGPYGD